MKHKFILPITLLFIFFFQSCLNKIDEVEVNYQGTLAFPLADISFKVQDLLDNDSVLTANDNNAIQLIHREENIAHIQAEDFFAKITDQLSATGYFEQALGKVQLDNYSQNANVTFQELLDEFNNSAIQQFFENNNGQNVPIMAFSEQVDKDINLPLFDDFTNLDVESGIIEVTIQNGYFIDIQDLTLNIKDVVTGQDLGSLNFQNIPVGEARTENLQLLNQSISNEITVNLPTFSSPGSTNAVLIDLMAELQIEMAFKDFIITGGEARLMGNEVLKDSSIVEIEPTNEAELTQLDLENGVLNYSMKSDFSHELKTTIIFPNVLKNGNPLNVTMTLPPTGLNDSISGFIDFSGTSLMLDQDSAQPYNQMNVELEAEVVDPSNSLIVFNAQDLVSFSFEMTNPKVQNAFGYFGQFEEDIEAGMVDLGFEFDFINENSSPSFFENAAIKIESENSFGVPISTELLMTSFGILNPNQTLNSDEIEIPYPTINEFGEMISGINFIDSDNSNIVDFLSNYPNHFEYEGSAMVNQEGNQGEVNFVTQNSELILHGEFELPFKLKTENIIYRDTAEAFNLDLDDGLTIDDIREGELKLLFENSLPFEIQVDILTENNQGQVSTLIDNLTIQSASVNNEGVVESQDIFNGETFISLSQSQLRQMDEALENIFEIRLSSFENGNTPVSILTENGLNMNVGLKLFFE